MDTFGVFTRSLAQRDKEALKEFIREQRIELLAARSEDARTRIVHDFIEQVYEMSSSAIK